MKLAWDSFSNPPKAINWQYASARQSAVFSTTAYCLQRIACPNARSEYIGAHRNGVFPGDHSHTLYLNPEFLSGVKNDV
ncbi:hypothetical protein OP063_000846 [Salmonella enterica subsp. enterica]|nr:hypothetical protein [Salmonella enterica]EKC4579037.1 hypothetical protein [Salmonella enterica subsp. enterica]EKQ9763186.1 hypothetical protein [Salmonella enterica subsp. enterica serovar Sandiego]EHO9103147.1 hypothetical protein [Salmonella enterica]EIU9581032.1 hypothetical protein [Salmonella enterica]